MLLLRTPPQGQGAGKILKFIVTLYCVDVIHFCWGCCRYNQLEADGDEDDADLADKVCTKLIVDVLSNASNNSHFFSLMTTCAC